MNALDIQFYDLERCITIKEFSFGCNRMGEVPVIPPIPRVDETVFLDDIPYTVVRVLHDWSEPTGQFIGTITTIHVRQNG